MTFKDVKTLSVRISVVISDQVVLKDHSITLSEQLHRVLAHKDTITKAERQRINQL